MTRDQTLQMPLNLMPILTLRDQAQILQQMNNVQILFGPMQPEVYVAWCMFLMTNMGLMDDDAVPKHFQVPDPRPTATLKLAPKPKAAPKPGP
eukprot:CAMPEP_0174348666 /NCGR_PEP_ID=MMETSP0811_2-20130205/5245_1 /TAXON_ID=73025 ORGANISM="Eutreptiella gymnastica-like, Strain CCMP1594" /NCGR_SAMPLE_ID=MMETSP0811_2 /ASSEMBLY_ACC=CAM_ASM_000667 /LENGTH=92 /DNA_ID=CAMNT_0015475455 /DNA_START=36 /DNA_END=312 /DNA_ORIENTATION=-